MTGINNKKISTLKLLKELVFIAKGNNIRKINKNGDAIRI